MITFLLNNKEVRFEGDEKLNLLQYLRNEAGITSAKDGCSEQAACGTCLIEIDGKPKLACAVRMNKVADTEVVTMEGIPEQTRDDIVNAFVAKGAVQCGYCTPGMIMRTKILLQDNDDPTLEEVQLALKQNLCRCTGYKKIEQAILLAAEAKRDGRHISLPKTSGIVGVSHPKYEARDTALGSRDFTADMHFDGMLTGALKFTKHPRAIVKSIDTSEAGSMEGVHAIFTAKDIPGNQKIGLIRRDWPLMIDIGQTTNCVGDVLAAVVAVDEVTARKALELIRVEYDILEPITDVLKAAEPDADRVHPESSNVIENCVIKRGDFEDTINHSAFVSKGTYRTQRIEHGFMEIESAVAKPWGDGGVEVFSQGQGVYEDRRQISELLGLEEEKVRVTLVSNGGGFGGKEDLSVQGHVALFAWKLGVPVKVSLTRDESILMHPKRHPIVMDMVVGCDEKGKLSALKLRAWGDTGAYASVGMKVLERVAGHASGGYFIPVIDVESRAVYTNNIPAGAMRGFGANQVAFAIESCVDEICEMGGFDRWQFRYDNALTDGLKTSTGQVLEGVGIRACLEALKDDFYKAKYAGIACAIKNSGIGNGMSDDSTVRIEIQAADHVVLHHGWTEMGQGVHTMALQMLCNETGIDPDIIEVKVDTKAGLPTGMTTASRGTALVGNAVIEASKAIRKDLETHSLADLVGRSYEGKWVCDWTNKPSKKVDKQVTHYSYGYAAQLCVLNDEGEIDTMYAAHDAGRIVNPLLFEGQIEGSLHMGVGYALCEDLPMKDGHPLSTRLRNIGILRAHQTPKMVVHGVEVPDPVGPHGVKGVGEIGLVPTAPAVANALYQFDGVRRYRLPLQREKYVNKRYVYEE